MSIQARGRNPVYDVVVVGSGAAGGITAKVLVERGLRVAMIEAGALRDPLKDFAYHEPFPYDKPLRGLDEKTSEQAIVKERYSFIKNPDEPYSTPTELPYDWFRARNVGGRTMFWGRFINRFHQTDLKGYSNDGQGKDWPISYADV
nr:GMC family oxidoreductase [Acidobacteriota bacterium]